VEWAKAARLLRVSGGRLVQVKKHARLLEQPQQLWDALFDALLRIGGAIFPSSGWVVVSVLSQEYETGLKTLLHRLYAAAGLVAMEELYEVVWQAVSAPYVLDDVPAERLRGWRGSNDRDVHRVLEALAALGAVELTGEGAELTGRGRGAVARMRGEPRPGDAVLQLRVELADIDEPVVWRRIQVPAVIRLDRLHLVIQVAMGWHNCHMHAFTANGVQYGRPHPRTRLPRRACGSAGRSAGRG
jgi:Plasmid pRiA4b ORF-3-like protein